MGCVPVGCSAVLKARRWVKYDGVWRYVRDSPGGREHFGDVYDATFAGPRRVLSRNGEESLEHTSIQAGKEYIEGLWEGK